MNKEVTCAGISKSMDRIKKIKNSFDQLFSDQTKFSPEKASRLEAIKDELSQKIEELENQISPLKRFLNELAKPQTWEDIKGLYRKEIDSGAWENVHADHPDGFFHNLEKMFSKAPRGSIDNRGEYEDFLGKFLTSNIEAKLAEVDECIKDAFLEIDPDWMSDYDNYIKEKGGKFLLSALHSVFLNKYLSNDAVLTFDRPPESLYDNFGCYLERGTFNITQAGDYAGLCLNGATLNIEVVGKELAQLMKNGVVRAKHAGYGPGMIMYGGTLRVTESVGPEFAGYAGGSAVILADKIHDIDLKANVTAHKALDSFTALMLIDRKDTVIKDEGVYNANYHGDYWDTESVWPASEIRSLEEYTSYIQTYKEKKKLVMVNLESDQNLTEGLDGGIVVFFKAPKKEIGRGMSGGAVILEDEDLSVEEAKKRISKEDRTGGIILMRVPDPSPDDPRRTKLIDLEMPDDWN